MPILIENNKYYFKSGCVMLDFKQDGEHAGNSNALLKHRKPAFAIAQIKIKNLKNQPSCGKKKTIN